MTRSRRRSASRATPTEGVADGGEPARPAIGSAVQGGRSWDLRRELWWVSGLIVATLSIAAVLLQLWDANFSAPFDYGGDASYMLAYIKDIAEHTWYETNPLLAAPSGAELYDFPALSGDGLQLVLMKVLSLGSSNAPTVMNVFYVLTYPMVAVSAFVALRALRLSRPSSATCALLFAFIPFHFLRAEYHLTFSAYYGVPIAAYLVLQTFAGNPLFSRRAHARRRWTSWLSRRSVSTVVLCVIAGTASEYYAFFGILIIALGAPFAALRTRRPAILATAAAVIALIGAAIVLDYSPTLVYRAVHGTDAQVVQRAPVESELYSLRLIQLILPNSLDRISGLGSADAYYNAHSVIPQNESTTASLGVVGAVGFLWLLAVASFGLLGIPEGPVTGRLVRDAAFASVLAFLIGTTGGIGAVVSFLVFPDIRAYNRISPFISFLALLGIGVLLDGLGRLVARRGWPAAIATVVTLFVLAFGIFEETPLTSTPPYAQSAAIYHSDDAFVHHIQAVAGRSASIFELPYERLPALVAGEGSQYANIIGYVHSRTLKWSYGSFPGRPQDWQSSLVVQPLSLVLPSIVAAGFTGIQVDRAAYAPPQLASILAALSSLPHSNGFTSGDGHFAFVDLTAYAQALERQLGPGLATLRAATLHPLTTEYGAGFFGPDAGPNDPRWAGRTAILTIHNPASHAQSATYSAILKTGYAKPYEAQIAWPGERRRGSR